MSSNVLLLRAPSQDSDPYHSILTAAGYNPFSVPVLETAFTNLGQLSRIMRRGPQKHYAAVIITSGRACEAWRNTVDVLENDQLRDIDSSWSTTPFYVVGKTTVSLLRAIGSAHPHSPFSPVDIRGESSGTSEQLAKFILSDLGSSPPVLPFLYLTGDKNRETLPEILRGGNVGLNPLQVYRTQGSSTFAEDLKLALESHREFNSAWIVFFAPSAAEFVLPHLRRHFDLSSPIVRIASIGPTTAAFLKEKLDMEVHAVAEKPTPECLLQAMVAA
ncbi:tetrapyrrole biosynthesis, uroporphyrinogen III synthase [Roridomyces roridus]|uniref:Tetrapyrrole biosynthesis, uroporphyrinogen III synthase n=1 Tax=Roridomyces roridus TaxID=1738132 RepID=A0AAD7CLS9_9AGAR|nr:tetrapyrrole biosynthesis, uroporphyrinogen III synthase [Roridomyces roridus]